MSQEEVRTAIFRLLELGKDGLQALAAAVCDIIMIIYIYIYSQVIFHGFPFFLEIRAFSFLGSGIPNMVEISRKNEKPEQHEGCGWLGMSNA